MAFSRPTFLLPSEDTFTWFELMSEEGIFLMLSLSQILIVIQKYMIGFRLLLLAFVWHGMEHIDFQGSWDFWSFPTFGVLCMYLYTINVIYLVWFQIWKKKFSPALCLISFFGSMDISTWAQYCSWTFLRSNFWALDVLTRRQTAHELFRTWIFWHHGH